MAVKDLIARLKLNAKDFEKGLKKSEKKTNRFSKTLKKVGGVIAAAFAGRAIIGAIKKFTIGLGDTADRLLDLEQITGMTTTKLQEYQMVAKQAGVNSETISNAVQGLTRRMSNATSEASPFNRAMAQMGINARNADGSFRGTGEVMDDLIMQLSQMEDTTKRNTIGQLAFGGAWADMAPILSMGADGIAQARKQAHELGMVMDRESIVKANEFRQSIVGLKARFQGIGIEIGTKLIPYFRSFTEWLSKTVEWAKANGDQLKKWGKIIGIFTGLVVAKKAALIAYLAVTKTIRVATKAWIAVQRALNLAMKANPIGFIIELVIALIGIFVNAWKTNDKFKQRFQIAWASIKGFFAKTIAFLKMTVKGFAIAFTLQFRLMLTTAKATWAAIKAAFKKGESPAEAFKREMKKGIDNTKEDLKAVKDEYKDTVKDINNEQIKIKAEIRAENAKKAGEDAKKDFGEGFNEEEYKPKPAGGGISEAKRLKVEIEPIKTQGAELMKGLQDQIDQQPKLKVEMQPIDNAALDMSSFLTAVDATESWGKKLGMLNEKLIQTKSQYGANSEQVKILQEQIKNVTEANALEIGIMKQLQGNLAKGAQSWQEYGNSVISAVKDAITAYLAETIAATIKNSAVFSGHPAVAAIVAGISVGAMKTLFNTMLPSFAEGGTVRGPTLAMVGDNPSGVEHIIPDEKLRAMAGGGNMELSGNFILRGTDLVASFDKTKARNKRK